MNKIGILQGRLTASNGRGIQFFPTENWKNEFPLAKKIGFEAMELLVKGDSFRDNPLFLKEGREKITALASENKIETSSVHGFYSKEEWYPEIAATLIGNARNVGARTVLISFSHGLILKNEADKEFARSQLQKAVAAAESVGSRIAIETEMLAPELKEFVLSFNSPAVGVYYDIGNMVSMNANIVKEIALLNTLIFGVHIKDRTKNGGKTLPLGTGDADFKDALAAFHNIGYDGPYILQGARKERVSDDTLNQQYFEYIKKILEEIYGH